MDSRIDGIIVAFEMEGVVQLMIVEDESADLVKDLEQVLSFRRAWMESSVVFEESM